MRDICWFLGTAGHLMKMRDCPSECGTVDTYGSMINIAYKDRKTNIWVRAKVIYILYTTILLKSVAVRKLQVASLARLSREMYQTVCINWRSILSQVRISVRPSNFFIREKHKKTRRNRVPSRECLFEWTSARPLIASDPSKWGINCITVGCQRPIEQRQPEWRRRCVRVYVCVMCLQYTIIIFDPGW